MRVLVTGATGFIGTALCRELRAGGLAVDTVSRTADGDCAERDATGWRIRWPEGLERIDYSPYRAVVHLAIPATPDAGEDSCRLQETAMRHLIGGVAASGSGCAVVFLSSQSAAAEARSSYGRGKWRCERLLQSSGIPHVIVRPGLVVSRSSAAGLFGRIAAIVRRLPVVAVPHSGMLLVQPVRIEDLTAALARILADPEPFDRTTIGVALPPRSLPDLVRDTCWEFRLRRLVVPLPASVARALLNTLAKLLPRLPLAASHLDGLQGGSPIEPGECLRLTGVRLLPFGLPRNTWPPADRLAWEAVFLSRRFFGRDPSRRMILRYADAHAVLPQLSSCPPPIIPSHPASGLVAEAVERVERGPTSALTAKFQVLGCLAEVEPAFRESFRPDRPRPFAAWLSLVLHAAALPLLVALGSLAAAVRRLGGSPHADQHD